MTPDISTRRAAFRALHAEGCFVLPNPWNVGTARMCEQLGFKALASTSSGLAWSRGCADGQLSREETLAHLRELVMATSLPVNADFESGFGETPEDVAESVRMAVDTGVAGISVEDSTGDASHPLRDIDDAIARMRAARASIDEAGGDTMLVGRAENYFVGRPDPDDTIARLRAYSEAGADCLYAPGIRTREEILAVVAAVAPKPVNLLIGPVAGMTLAEVAALGVRRVSVGGALARAAWGGFLGSLGEIAGHGRFDGSPVALGNDRLNELFSA